ncbi:protein kinase [Tardiphaga sp. P9-11]|uniref:protein kinase domain-containing protein n=1 Tax=Tardiphaga sp. P9-11 TaxID=2024614 RepID=UPI0011F1D2F6|nr:protein kinase [Tardiphaga sp. P9-11]KAA0075885.1 hypothetical protein CIW50_06315 [Tardiphaga sp. P9-11]
MAFKVKITKDVFVENGTLHLGKQTVDRFVIRGILGKGANGVVFDAHHLVLNQPRAIKVWLKLGGTDTRDKVTQGIAEAQKLAASDPRHVVMIYDAETAGQYLYSSMEKITGRTLAETLKDSDDLHTRWMLARGYIHAIQSTTTSSLYHGDAHPGNVMVYDEDGDYGTMMRMKLLDFGTSLFSGKENSRARHWRIVYETFVRIIAPFNSKDWALEQSIPYEGREDALRCAYFDDVIDGLGMELGHLDGLVGFSLGAKLRGEP